MKYGHTIVYVPVVAESLAFFEKAFGFKRRMLTDESDYGELETGTTTLAFAAHQLAESNTTWGQTVSYLRCPDGTLVELCTPVG